MNDLNKEFDIKEWIYKNYLLNNRNIFDLPRFESLSLSAVQYEIINQIESKKIKNISDFLTAQINVSKNIKHTKISIDEVLNDFLKKERPPFISQFMSVGIIYSLLRLCLFIQYANNNIATLLTLSAYKENYERLKNDFIKNNIDTDEADFISVELKKCTNIINELELTVYNEFCSVSDSNNLSEFKKNLLNSIDKRVKFLRQKKELISKPTTNEIPQPQPTTQIQVQPSVTTNTNEFSFINNFDNVEPKTVYEHFFNSLVKEKNYIDEDTLKNYLITVFQNGQSLKETITLNNSPTKRSITAIFYNYYSKIAGKPHGRQNDYIKLLSDNFTGFNEDSLKSNFSKSTY